MTPPLPIRRASTVVLAAAVASLAGCGGSGNAPPEDRALRLDLDAGAAAVEVNRNAEAARDYQGAYRRALVLDDADALATAAIDEAIAREDAGDPAGALAVAAAARGDLALRGAAAPAELAVAEAAALLRLDRPAEAAAAATVAENATDAAVAARAAFLRGLAADRLGDRAALVGSIARLPPPTRRTDAAARADRAELVARLALRDGDRGGALVAAEDAIAARRTALDTSGLRRALALAAAAAPPDQRGGFEAALAESRTAEATTSP